MGYLYDGRGSNAEFRYDPFGEVQSEVGQEPIFGYNGESYNPATELQYLRYRYYSPEDGRFQNADSDLGDTIEPRTLNRYAYTGNDPINLQDPTGHGWFGAVIGGVVGLFAGNPVAGAIVGYTIEDFFTPKPKPPEEEIAKIQKEAVEKIKEDAENSTKDKPKAPGKISSSTEEYLKQAEERIRELCNSLSGSADPGEDTPNIPYVTPAWQYTREQERTNDFALKKRWQTLITQQKYSDVEWNKDNGSQRENILNALLVELKGVLGLSDVKNKIDFNMSSDSIGDGFYSDRKKEISYKRSNFGELTREENLKCIIHEARHAYQHETIRGSGHIVSVETIQWWAWNFADGNYISDSSYDYYTQPIEWDAYKFSDTLPRHIMLEEELKYWGSWE